MNKPSKKVSPPTWVEDQEKPRLIVPIEPTPEELKDWPFLNNLGGLLTKFRHPWLVWFCNCFVAYRLSMFEKTRLLKLAEDTRAENEANKENWTEKQTARKNEEMCKLVDLITMYSNQEVACKQSLDDLKDGKFEGDGLLMEDICMNGKFFNVSQEGCEAMIRLIKGGGKVLGRFA